MRNSKGQFVKGYKHTDEWKKEASKRNSGKNNGFYGKYHTKKTKLIMSKKKRGWKAPKGVKSLYWKGGKPKCLNCNKQLANYGSLRCNKCARIERFKNYSLEDKIKHSRSIKRTLDKIPIKIKLKRYAAISGVNHPNWQGGKSGEPYFGFTLSLKERIRKRDNYQCQNSECNMTEEEHLIVYGINLTVHHIDYNKKNNDENNLITLCKQCNSRVNFNRSCWENFFRDKIKESGTIKQLNLF